MTSSTPFAFTTGLLKPQTALEPDFRFTVTHKIGRGQFAEVYYARDRASDDATLNACAIKIESAPRTCAREAKVMRALHGKKHFCKLLSESSHEGKPYIAMELVGETVAEARSRRANGRLSLATASALAIAMIEALETLHNEGYVHRDIKPGNVCVGVGDGAEREVYLIDFGLARKFVDDDGNAIPERKDATFRGTTTYASVYAHEGKEQSARDDLFSTLYVIAEAIEGVLPWKAEGATLSKPEIAEMKRACLSAPSRLFTTMECPEAVDSFARIIRTLKYGEKPNYAALKAPFERALVDGGPQPLDWEIPAPASAPVVVPVTSNSPVPMEEGTDGGRYRWRKVPIEGTPTGAVVAGASYAAVAANDASAGTKRQRDEPPRAEAAMVDDRHPATPPPPPAPTGGKSLVLLAHTSPKLVPARIADIVLDVAHNSSWEENLAIASGLLSYVVGNTVNGVRDFPSEGVRASVLELKDICFRCVGDIEKYRRESREGPGVGPMPRRDFAGREGPGPGPMPRRDFAGGGAQHARRGPGGNGKQRRQY